MRSRDGERLAAVRRVRAQLLRYREDSPPLDAMSALCEFRERSERLARHGARHAPLLARARLRRRRSAEVLGETEMIVRLSGKPLQKMSFAPVDSLRAELDASPVRSKVARPIRSRRSRCSPP